MSRRISAFRAEVIQQQWSPQQCPTPQHTSPQGLVKAGQCTHVFSMQMPPDGQSVSVKQSSTGATLLQWPKQKPPTQSLWNEQAAPSPPHRLVVGGLVSSAADSGPHATGLLNA